jgi:hypothetical protein
MIIDPESIKKIDNLTVFVMLPGSGSTKAVHRMLMKLSQGFFLNNICSKIEKLCIIFFNFNYCVQYLKYRDP